jgi:hypothetical protein
MQFGKRDLNIKLLSIYAFWKNWHTEGSPFCMVINEVKFMHAPTPSSASSLTPTTALPFRSHDQGMATFCMRHYGHNGKY